METPSSRSNSRLEEVLTEYFRAVDAGERV
jgi:hypothetical protein